MSCKHYQPFCIGVNALNDGQKFVRNQQTKSYN